MTPINSIKSFLNIISNRASPEDININENISACKDSVSILQQLIQNFNDL
jgi:hypothetical protein